jgi:hypothetical protein
MNERIKTLFKGLVILLIPIILAYIWMYFELYLFFKYLEL